MKRITCVFLIFCLCFSLAGCGQSETNEGDSVSDGGVEAITPEEAIDVAEDIVKSMPLDEKIGQMFMLDIDKLSSKGVNVTKMTAELQKSIEKYKIGGVVLDSGNIQSVEKVKELNDQLSSCLRVPLYIATEEEGGGVKSIAATNDEIKSTGYTTPSEMGSSMTDVQLENTGEVIAKELSDLGFNLNFAPSANVMMEEDSVQVSSVSESAVQAVGQAPVWKKPSKKMSKKKKKKKRAAYDKKLQEYKKKLDAFINMYSENGYMTSSFSRDEDKVSDAVTAMVNGMHKKNVGTVLKTFPGIASVERYHKLIPCGINTGLSRLRRVNFAPFDAGIEAQTDLIMVGHVSLSKIDGSTPASLSEIIMSQLIRDEMGFEGVLITEPMDVPVITNNYTTQQAVIRSVVAGADMIYDPEDIGEAVLSLKQAVMFREIDEKVINQAVMRIIQNKILRGIYKVNNK